MSRSGYSCDLDNWAIIKYRGQVTSAIRGARGQRFLKELAYALDILSEKRLIKKELIEGDQVCALGAIGISRGMNLASLDPEDAETLGAAFGIAHQLVREIEWMNDDYVYEETPEERWIRIRLWVESLLEKPE